MGTRQRRQPEDAIQDWYGAHHQEEWKRLEQDAYHQLEQMVTLHFLRKHLPARGLILDAGGGPGRYAVELARTGHNMVLLDLVPEMVALARTQAKRARVNRRFKGFHEGSIVDLSRFDDDTFDAVLCLGGPLSHVLEQRQRVKAARELVRVAKPNAPILVSVISRLGLLRGMLTLYPEQMRHAKRHWETGDYVPGVNGVGFTAAHWFLPEELRALFEKESVRVIEMAGLEGLSAHHQAATNELRTHPQRWRAWRDILLQTCTHPSVVGTSEHFLLVARKKS